MSPDTPRLLGLSGVIGHRVAAFALRAQAQRRADIAAASLDSVGVDSHTRGNVGAADRAQLGAAVAQW